MIPPAREPRRLPLLVVPVSFYLAMTIGVPLTNAAATEPGFWEHALTTLVVTGIITAVALGVRRFLRRS